MSQNPIHHNIDCFNYNNCYNVQNNYVVPDDRYPLLTWLSPLEPRLRQQDIQEQRVNNVGEWLLETEELEFEAGMTGMVKVRMIRQSCFTMEV